MKAKALRAQRAKLIEGARALVNARYATADDHRRFDSMMAAADHIKARIDRAERLEAEEHELQEALIQRPRANAGVASPRGRLEAPAAFDAYLRGGIEELSPAMRAVLDYQKFNAAMGTTTGRDGGFTVPDGFYHDLISAERAYGGMLSASNILDTDSGNPLSIPTDDDTGNVGAILHEN